MTCASVFSEIASFVLFAHGLRPDYEHDRGPASDSPLFASAADTVERSTRSKNVSNR